MRRFFTVIAILAVTLSAAAESKPKMADLTERQIFQFVSVTESENLGISGGGGGMVIKEHNYQITAKTAVSAQSKTIVLVAAKDSSFAKDLAAMKPGDYFAAALEHKGGNPYDFAKSFVPYSPQPGEDRPNVFLFVETSTARKGAEEFSQVKLYKLGLLVTVNVPNVKNAAGKSEPDPAITQTLTKLQPADTVEVSAQGAPVPTLKSIDPYTPLKPATFTKSTQVADDKLKIPAIEISIDGAAQTLLLPGKASGNTWTSDPQFAATLKSLKEGDKILIRTRESDGKLWLKEITRPREK